MLRDPVFLFSLRSCVDPLVMDDEILAATLPAIRKLPVITAFCILTRLCSTMMGMFEK